MKKKNFHTEEINRECGFHMPTLAFRTPRMYRNNQLNGESKIEDM